MSSSFSDEAGRKFAEYHTENPEIWSLFERLSFEWISMGHKKFGAMAILNRIRWEELYNPRNKLDGPKVTNTWAPFYARLFLTRYPHHAEFFVTKPSVADDCMDYIRRLAKSLAGGAR